MAKNILKLSDLAQLGAEVEIAPEQWIRVRALSLSEMIQLFLGHVDDFLSLYNKGAEGALEVKDLLPFLLASPRLVGEIIARAADEPDGVDAVVNKMAATSQLIALQEIWRLSVPDQKKAKKLWSEVTALLQKHKEKQEANLQQTNSNQESAKQLIT